MVKLAACLSREFQVTHEDVSVKTSTCHSRFAVTVAIRAPVLLSLDVKSLVFIACLVMTVPSLKRFQYSPKRAVE